MAHLSSNNAWRRRDRRRFAKAEGLLSPCNLPASGRWADLGCGDGIFTGVLVDLLGPGSTVAAIDRSPRALRQLQRNLNLAGWVHQVQPMLADFRVPLPLGNLDGLLMANALHFLRDGRKTVAFRTFLPAVKAGGRIIVVEYNTERSTAAVPHPVTASQLRRLLVDAGWRHPQIAARVPSTYLGEMTAVQAFRREDSH